MPLLDNQLARRSNDRLELRPGPVRVRWELNDLVSSDGHELRCAFTCSVRAIPERTERRMLEEVLLNGRQALTAEDVSAHFSGALRASAAKVAQSHGGQAFVEDESLKKSLIDALKASAGAVAFTCGLEVLPPFEVHLGSPTLERQRLRAIQQALAEREAAGQAEHFARSAELLRQFTALRTAAPDLPAGRILQQVSPSDRGSLLQSLLLAGSKQQSAEHLWAVAGPYLVRVGPITADDGRTISPKPELFPLPPALGPLRSVRAANVDGRRMLLVGARSGFLLVDPENPTEAEAYTDPCISSQHGFNGVVYCPSRRQFCATHSDGGLVCWNAGTPAEPETTMRSERFGPSPEPVEQLSSGSIRVASPAGPRNLQLLDDSTLIFSVGSHLMTWDGVAATLLPIDPDGEVIALFSADRQLLAVYEGGTVVVLDRRTKQVISRERRSGRVRAAAALPWLGGARLLLAGDEGPVQCVGFDDPLITQYASAYRGLRLIAAAPDRIAAASPDRQRLVFWHTWDGRQPAAEAYVLGLTKHRIADVQFG